MVIKNKIVIITSVIGGYETLKDPTVVHRGVNYVAFVDKINSNIKVWKQIEAVDFTVDSRYKGRRNAKIYKILPEIFLPEYDYYCWVDCSHDYIMNPYEIVSEYFKKDNDFACFLHRERNCVYREIDELIRINFDYIDKLKAMRNELIDNNYPSEFGLFELPVFIKKKSQKSLNISLTWWEYICRLSSRDQISFIISLMKHNGKVDVMPGLVNQKHNESNNVIAKQTRPHVNSAKGGKR